jgi:hypothetical protein
MLSCGRSGTDGRTGYLICPLAPVRIPSKKILSMHLASTVAALSTASSDVHARLYRAAHLPHCALHRTACLHYGICAATAASAAHLSAEQVLAKGALAQTIEQVLPQGCLRRCSPRVFARLVQVLA